MVKEPFVEQGGPDQQWNTMQRRVPFDVWMSSTGLPIYRGFSVLDPRSIELADWPERGCQAAFLQLEGMRSVSEARLSGLRPGQKTEPWKTGAGELVYVLDGRGTADIWTSNGPQPAFDWHRHSLFLLPRNCWHQLRNTGSETARLLHYSHLPMAMSAIPDVDFHFRSPAEEPRQIAAEDFYSSAVMLEGQGFTGERELFWHTNAIDDVNAWEKLEPAPDRGAGNREVRFQLPSSDMSWHISEFAAGQYKKASKFGPARLVVVTQGEGYSVMWFRAGIGQSATRFRDDRLPELDETGRAIIPWREGSIFASPDNWYVQHFNTGSGPARYLALHPLPQFTGASYAHQIEYADEDPWFHRLFERELAARGLVSEMPPQR